MLPSYLNRLAQGLLQEREQRISSFSTPHHIYERKAYFGDYHSAMTALLIGKPLVGMRALDICRGVDLLSTRPEVDRERIYGLGKEGGSA